MFLAFFNYTKFLNSEKLEIPFYIQKGTSIEEMSFLDKEIYLLLFWINKQD
jgi:hypothetical protein